MKLSNKELAKELHKQLFENLRKEKYTHLLKAMFEALILKICNWSVNLTRNFDFYCVSLTFIANMHGLFL